MPRDDLSVDLIAAVNGHRVPDVGITTVLDQDEFFTNTWLPDCPVYTGVPEPVWLVQLKPDQYWPLQPFKNYFFGWSFCVAVAEI